MLLLLMKKNKIVGLIDDGYELALKINRKLYPPIGLLNLSMWRNRRFVDFGKGMLIHIDYFTDGLYNLGTYPRNIADDVRLLSLKDDYWVCPLKLLFKRPKWEDINFFNNEYGCGMRHLHALQHRVPNISDNLKTKFSPDNTTQGTTPKFWEYHDGKNVLYKQCINMEYRDCLQILNEMRSEHNLPVVKTVKYTLAHDMFGEKFWVCNCFTNENLSYVELPFMIKNENKTSIQDITKRFKKIEGFSDYMEMLVLSTYLTKTILDSFDIGFLCDEKNRVVSYAPIMDTRISYEDKYFLPFDNTENEIKKYIKEISWLSIDEYQKRIAKIREENKEN